MQTISSWAASRCLSTTFATREQQQQQQKIRKSCRTFAKKSKKSYAVSELSLAENEVKIHTQRCNFHIFTFKFRETNRARVSLENGTRWDPKMWERNLTEYSNMSVNRKKGVVKIKGKIFNRARKNCDFGMESMLENSMISFCPYKHFKLVKSQLQ